MRTVSECTTASPNFGLPDFQVDHVLVHRHHSAISIARRAVEEASPHQVHVKKAQGGTERHSRAKQLQAAAASGRVWAQEIGYAEPQRTICFSDTYGFISRVAIVLADPVFHAFGKGVVKQRFVQRADTFGREIFPLTMADLNKTEPIAMTISYLI